MAGELSNCYFFFKFLQANLGPRQLGDNRYVHGHPPPHPHINPWGDVFLYILTLERRYQNRVLIIYTVCTASFFFFFLNPRLGPFYSVIKIYSPSKTDNRFLHIKIPQIFTRWQPSDKRKCNVLFMSVMYTMALSMKCMLSFSNYWDEHGKNSKNTPTSGNLKKEKKKHHQQKRIKTN